MYLAAEPKPGQWIIVRDFDQNRMPGGLRPTLAQLDQASSDYPMIIQHQSGHMGFFNSAALSLLQVTPQTPVPEGGTIEKKEGMLTGYMEENAFFQYQKKVPMPGPEEISDAFCRAQKIYASHGITTIQEGMLVEEMLPFYQILLDKNLLYLVIGFHTFHKTFLQLENRRHENLFGRLTPGAYRLDA